MENQKNNSPIKVLVISNYRSYHTARPEAHIFIGLAKLGFDITIMTYGDAKLVEEFKAVGIKIIDFHPEKKFNKLEIAKIREVLINEKIDIVHLFNSISTVNGLKAAKGLDTKVVLYRGYTGNINWWDPTAYLKYLNPRVDKIFCNSIGVEELFKRQLFFDKNKAITINKGHNLSWYEGYDPYDIRTELGIDESAFLLVKVANNRRMKGIPYLMETMNLLRRGSNIHLILVGRDMDTKENLAILKKGGMLDRVHFIGFRDNALNIVAACDAFVLSSITGESITKSVIEAMSLGVPPIITDIPGNVELVQHGESGLVTRTKKPSSMADAINRIYEDPIFCKQLGANAKKRVLTHLNTEQTVLKTKEMYENLLNS